MESRESPTFLVSSGLSLILRTLILVIMLGAFVFVALNHQYGPVFVCIAGSISAMIYLPVAFYKGVLVPLWRGVQCPTCREWGLVHVASLAFGHRFFRCDHCGQRCKRRDYESPWVDASGLADDDMYKPVPCFGPARKREAWISAVRTLGGFLAIFVLAGFGWLVGGEAGMKVGSALGTGIFCLGLTASWADDKKVLPIQPVLWDRAIDE